MKPDMPWQPMETAPRDGSSFNVLCRSKDGVNVEVANLHFGHAPMDKNKWLLWGVKNFLSPYFDPIGWKPK